MHVVSMKGGGYPFSATYVQCHVCYMTCLLIEVGVCVAGGGGELTWGNHIKEVHRHGSAGSVLVRKPRSLDLAPHHSVWVGDTQKKST